MYIYMCMYVWCVCVFVYIYTHIHTHTHTHIYIYVCIYTNIYVCVCVCICKYGLKSVGSKITLDLTEFLYGQKKQQLKIKAYDAAFSHTVWRSAGLGTYLLFCLLIFKTPTDRKTHNLWVFLLSNSPLAFTRTHIHTLLSN